MDILKNEPALIRNVLLAIAALVAAFGFSLDAELLTAGMAIFSVVTGIDIRRKVSPVGG